MDISLHGGTMELSLNSQSAQALREFADAIPRAVERITNDTVKLISLYQSISEQLGVHRDDFYLVLLHIQKMQIISAEALEVLPIMMRKTADEIDDYIAGKSKVIIGQTFAADKEIHNHETIIKYFSESGRNVGVRQFRTDISEAQKWGKRNYVRWYRSLTKSQRKSIYEYSGDKVYQELNRLKRANLPLSTELSRINDDICTALKSAVLQEDIVVYRAISENALRELALYCSQDKIEAGACIQEAAFMSCSLVGNNKFTNSRENKFIFRLTVPSGLHAAYIGQLSAHPYEQEMLVDENHFIYITSVIECCRKEITEQTFDNDKVTVIDGVLTI